MWFMNPRLFFLASSWFSLSLLPLHQSHCSLPFSGCVSLLDCSHCYRSLSPLHCFYWSLSLVSRFFSLLSLFHLQIVFTLSFASRLLSFFSLFPLLLDCYLSLLQRVLSLASNLFSLFSTLNCSLFRLQIVLIVPSIPAPDCSLPPTARDCSLSPSPLDCSLSCFQIVLFLFLAFCLSRLTISRLFHSLSSFPRPPSFPLLFYFCTSYTIWK